jgi:hypothetical protein
LVPSPEALRLGVLEVMKLAFLDAAYVNCVARHAGGFRMEDLRNHRTPKCGVIASVAASPQGFMGSMMSHPAAPSAAMDAAVTNDISQPMWAAIRGVREAEQAPPSWPPIFMIAEITPTFSPAISAETAQKPL